MANSYPLSLSVPSFGSVLCFFGVILGGSAVPAMAGLWSVPVTFQEFAGDSGGFPAGAVTWSNLSNPNPTPQSFDILKPVGTGPSDHPIYAAGRDGTPDLTITPKVTDYSDGRWAGVRAGKSNSGLEAGALVNWGTSRSGDAAVVSLELRFDPALQLTAGDFAMRLISANGTSELYEWTMITLGTADQAPFSLSRISDYTALDYSNTGSGTYYNAAGGLTGLPGTGQRLETGRSISQFLSDSPGSAVSGGLVQQGWYSIDDFNAVVFDSPEDFLDNPFSGDGALDDNQTVTGIALGLPANAPLTAITIWFGYHDVAFDTDGDGFTSTDNNIFERVAGLTLGSRVPASVPEPGISGLLLGLVSWAGIRRKR